MSDERDFVLSTNDNPYDPYTQWEDWYKFDMMKGYDCCGLVARMAHVSEYYSDEKNEKETLQAIEDIVNEQPLIYKKVFEPNK